MFNAKKIEQIARKIYSILLQTINNLKKFFNKKIKYIMQSKVTKFNLVSKEEFEIQKKTIIILNEKILKIEQRINNIEKNSLKEKNNLSQ
ncbi:accessory factor UbiK family protein [Candidatus Providencia siddallii]|uniref:Ubiquinone biosynthesis accessory factor UbiK n=1 Tax=Candidatus Providencia siddallii TaxID=1715285 RepID=A0ABM9NNC9_9GAMM